MAAEEGLTKKARNCVCTTALVVLTKKSLPQTRKEEPVKKFFDAH